jgi:hypothetical protein
VLLSAVYYKSPGHASNDADMTELLSFILLYKLLLQGDMNVKYPFWNSVVSNTSGEILMNLLPINEFEASAPQYSPHYCLARNGNMLDIVVHKNVRLSEVIVTDILDSDRFPLTGSY